MFFLLLAILILALYRVRVSWNGVHDDYLSKNKTDSIKGIFILLIVLTHSLQYIKHSSYRFDQFGDGLLLWFVVHLSQLVVVMFLFYSGYGVGESLKQRGEAYVNSFPRHRLLTTILNFDVAVVVFIVVWLILGVTFPLNKYMLSLIAWDGVGNSNWYIFVILLCYLFTYIALILPLPNRVYKVILLYALCFLTILVLSSCKGSWWYNTILCYPTGFLFSTYKDSFERVFRKYYWLVVGALAVLFVFLYRLPQDGLCLTFNALSIVFAFLVVVMSIKISIGNPVLQWVGNNLFPIYIYMRLPMLILENKVPNIIATQPAVFIVVSLLITVVVAHFYRLWQIKL